MSNFFFRLLTLAPLSVQARCCILVRCGLRLAREGFDFSCWHIAATGDGLRMIGTSNLNTWYGWPYQVPPSLKPEVQAQQVQPRSSWNSCGNFGHGPCCAACLEWQCYGDKGKQIQMQTACPQSLHCGDHGSVLLHLETSGLPIWRYWKRDTVDEDWDHWWGSSKSAAYTTKSHCLRDQKECCFQQTHLPTVSTSICQSSGVSFPLLWGNGTHEPCWVAQDMQGEVFSWERMAISSLKGICVISDVPSAASLHGRMMLRCCRQAACISQIYGIYDILIPIPVNSPYIFTIRYNPSYIVLLAMHVFCECRIELNHSLLDRYAGWTRNEYIISYYTLYQVSMYGSLS